MCSTLSYVNGLISWSSHLCSQIHLPRVAIPKDVVLYTDEDEWSTLKNICDTVFHIELRKWADIMVIAPLLANTLAKIAGGLFDNLLTCNS
ncbi:hypothetical protein ACS0TY_012843 [Phlomoides rotata]